MGWDLNGVNWNGTWMTTWGSESGPYYSNIYLSAAGQVGWVSGTYNNGTMQGWAYYVYDLGVVKAFGSKDVGIGPAGTPVARVNMANSISI